MIPKFRNIIMFIAIAAVFILIYVFFIKPSPEQENLVSTPSNASLPDVNNSGGETGMSSETSAVAKDFLALLLNVKNIKLNDVIFIDLAFNSLHDSSITLTPDGTEGRPNPFAQFGNDIVPTPPAPPAPPAPPTCTAPKVLNPSTNACVTPMTCTLPKVLDPLTNTCVTPPPNP
ncbi:MAG: hypothetical protein UV76_C0002G0113 [Candidatus Nomurabacteria bacterium GW2011_GWA2_43_15]|uniref:Uncharacterized protein n=2 Tax=Candidatus Nomuraibacteriota TaxID=1752729 RepID=A0A0G1DU82_9BACT|nr:MAG: hypothetical protein UV76_C0002G0113 [Candidatus Nomurabacteria bacterium GW2011_GWA2_43_15]KKT19845.1 MAG: hypothetical protein UW02_C0004G0022 [Candidatus Nomurabacteria bacterium GW2011_GWB1_43_7]